MNKTQEADLTRSTCEACGESVRNDYISEHQDYCMGARTAERVDSYNSAKTLEPSDALEALIDVHGLARIVEIVADVCDEKSNHLAENWQDYSAASSWAKIGQKLHNIKLPVV